VIIVCSYLRYSTEKCPTEKSSRKLSLFVRFWTRFAVNNIHLHTPKMDYKEIVTVNLNKLMNTTIVSGELATLAFQNGLVTQEEFEQLNAPEVSQFL